MTGAIAGMEEVLKIIVELAILLFEFTGVIVVVYSGIRAIVGGLKRYPQTKLNLAQGLTLGLSFKLGGEILRTVVAHELKDILIVAAIMALRAAMTILLHWEIKNEKKELKEAEEEG